MEGARSPFIGSTWIYFGLIILRPLAYGQSSNESICYVTLGVIQGAFFWATDKKADVEDLACKATGSRPVNLLSNSEAFKVMLDWPGKHSLYLH